MQIITVSATKARNDFFNILSWVIAGKSVAIQKDNVLVANITPISQVNKSKGLLKSLKLASVGFEYSKKDNPLRRKGSADFLGRWDK